MALEKEIQWFDELRPSLQTDGRLAWDAIRKALVEGQTPTTNNARDEIAALANELEDFNSRCVAPYGRITEIVEKMRQLSPVA